MKSNSYHVLSDVKASYKTQYKCYTTSNKLCSLRHVNMYMLT